MKKENIWLYSFSSITFCSQCFWLSIPNWRLFGIKKVLSTVGLFKRNRSAEVFESTTFVNFDWKIGHLPVMSIIYWLTGQLEIFFTTPADTDTYRVTEYNTVACLVRGNPPPAECRLTSNFIPQLSYCGDILPDRNMQKQDLLSCIPNASKLDFDW